ncbi:hypothetical protein [Anatilimnocola floriformis]|uniref:hypothetical protein n=1 Tax=Anatilimnocola floriformis TaxID=2948575 RepID=UPI0020C1D1AB|nr:hypothetical protein [Anatilimnocola floriformis]
MADDRKKQRLRSPAYPSINLQEAIEKASVIYRHEKRHAVPVDVVVCEHFGYETAASSGGLRAVAALKQFGLLVEEDGGTESRQVRLSNLALDILIAENESSPERLKAIKTAALSPPLHRKIWEKYGGHLPSNASLSAFLIREMEFNDAHVDKFIRQLSQTVAYARVAEPDTIEDDDDDLDSHESSDSATSYPNTAGRNQAPLPNQMTTTTYHLPTNPIMPSMGVVAETVNLPITMPSLKVAWLNVPSKLTKLEFDTLVNTLKMFEAALVQPPSLLAADPVEGAPK